MPLKSLLSAISVAAGDQANAHTAPTAILTYRIKSSGRFASADIKGASISADKNADDNIYGSTQNVKQLLLHRLDSLPCTRRTYPRDVATAIVSESETRPGDDHTQGVP